MTIYKPSNPERKVEKKPFTGPDVVPLTKSDAEDGTFLILGRPKTSNTDVLRRRRALRCVIVTVIALAVLIVSVTILTIVYRHVIHRPFMMNCQVSFHEQKAVRRLGVGSDASSMPQVASGSFDERVELDRVNGAYERLDVPQILDTRGSTVVHDFERNLTAIVEKERARCFVLPMDRTTVQPPSDFIDLLEKFKSGYYMPDVEVVRETYKVEVPAVDDVESFGYYIWLDCQFFETFRLVKDTEPYIANRKKRSMKDCSMEGKKFCLGGVGKKMKCITLSACVNDN